MNKRIIYATPNGGVAVIVPSEEWTSNPENSIEDLARKDVPAGAAFKIVEIDEVPNDRTFRSAWEIEVANPDGFGIGQNAWFIEKYRNAINAINAEAGPRALIPASFEQAGFPENFTEEQKQVAYEQLVAQVTERNAAALAQWEQSKAARIEQLNNMIAVQEAEMNA